MTLLSASILIFLVMDPFGNIPLFVSILDAVPAARHRRIVIREACIALGIMVVLLFAGPLLLKALNVSMDSLQIAGGIILFLIAIKMVFGVTDKMFGNIPEGDPLIVPLAVPLIAGPSMAATLVVLAGQAPDRRWEWLLALLLAWAAGTVILISATAVSGRLGRRGLGAMERLMGLLLTAIAVEMLVQGFRALVDG